MFKLFFKNVTEVSQGGLEMFDALRVQSVETEDIKFKKKEVLIGQDTFVTQPFLVPQKPLEKPLPPQVDLDNTLVQIQREVSDKIEKQMEGLTFGMFVLNFFVAVSMKKILQTIKVFQILAFLILMSVNFTPECQLLMQTIYNFATFKVVP